MSTMVGCDRGEQYCSKKTDAICCDVCNQESWPAVSMSRVRCILRGMDLKTLIILFAILPTCMFFIYLHGQKCLSFFRPIWESPPKQFNEIPHHYNENLSMENLCKLHGWQVREYPRRVFDAVLFSVELDLLKLRWKELYPYVNGFVLLESISTFTGIPKPLVFASNGDDFKFVEPRSNQRVALDKLLQIAGIMDDDLLIMSDVDEIPSRHTINLLRWRASVHVYQTGKTKYAHYRQGNDILADSGWHCSFCFRRISDFIFKMKAYSHSDRVREDTG